MMTIYQQDWNQFQIIGYIWIVIRTSDGRIRPIRIEQKMSNKLKS